MRGKAALRSLTTSLAHSTAFAKSVGVLEWVNSPRADVLTVLTYHRVADPEAAPDLDPSIISATPAGFEEQIAFLAANRRVLSLSELLDVRRGVGRLPKGSVMVTFDDAYRDFAEHAWPILRGRGLPVTLFVPTAYPDHPERTFWWDRLYQAVNSSDRGEPLDTPVGTLALETDADRSQAFRRLRDHLKVVPHPEALATVERLYEHLGAPTATGAVLGWGELRRLAAEGVTLAPHSRTHPLLDQLPLAEAQAEIAGSMSDLQREIGSAPPAFAYPAGAYTDAVVTYLVEAGFELAFTTGRGSNDLRRADWLRLRRINIGRRSTLPVIRAQLLSRPARMGHAAATGRG